MCTSSQNATNNLNLIIKENKEDLSDVQREREVMFEKKLTPSDVGKLNRLVIPKHHALTYFPLVSHDHGKSNLKKVTSLSFQDESGQWWRFRYSYWSSSQSYVLTKGWSRFVRQKQLHAGDVIYFQRQRMITDSFFIGWRRWRSSAMVEEHDGVNTAQTSSHPNGALLPYQRLTSHAGMSIEYQSPQTSVAAAGESKRTMRLFGVDFECQQQDEPDEVVSTDGSFPSSQVQA